MLIYASVCISICIYSGLVVDLYVRKELHRVEDEVVGLYKSLGDNLLELCYNAISIR